MIEGQQTYGSQWTNMTVKRKKEQFGKCQVFAKLDLRLDSQRISTQRLKKRTKFSRLSTSRNRSRKFVSLNALLPQEANPWDPLGDWPPAKPSPSTSRSSGFRGCEARVVPTMCCPLLCSPGATRICRVGSIVMLLISWQQEFFLTLAVNPMPQTSDYG